MKNMRKKISIIFTLVCILAFSITAYARNEAVTISSAEATTSTVTVSGTTNALAVMVQVRDDEDNIIKMESFGTVSGAFSGTIDDLSLKADTEYTVFVADYEGGDWTKITVKVPAATTEATTEATTAQTTQETTETTTQTTAEDTTKSEKAATTTPKAPQTGDKTPLYIIFSLMLISGGLLLSMETKRNLVEVITKLKKE